MTDESTTTPREIVKRASAGALSTLEDAEVALATRQAALSRELHDVNAELDRLAKVKRLLLGEPAPKRGSRPKKPSDTEANRDRVTTWLADRDNGEFSAGDIVEATGLNSHGLGPILSSLERRGVIVQAGMTDTHPPRKRYRVAETLAE
jgi:hypothetical protein